MIPQSAGTGCCDECGQRPKKVNRHPPIPLREARVPGLSIVSRLCANCWTRFSNPPNTKPERIYFIERADGMIKIGRSNNPTRRLREFERAGEDRVRILAQMPGDSQTELKLHQRFSHSRVEGEWFYPSLGLIILITSLPPIW